MKIFKSISEVQSQTVGGTLGWPQFTKRHYSHKNVDGVMVLIISAHCLMMFYIYTKFRENNQRVSEFLSGCDLYTKICKRSLFCKVLVELWYLVCPHRLIMLYIGTGQPR